MRPVLKSGLRTVWRDATTLQVGLDPDRAVVIAGVQLPDARLVAALDGTRDVAGLRELAVGLGLSTERAERLLALLGEAGALADAAEPVGRWRALDPAERDRLAPDVTSAALVGPSKGTGLATLERRAEAAVLVEGASRIGATTACLLAAAGVGEVAVRDEGLTTPADAAPAGLPPTAAGSRRADATRAAVRRAAPSARTSISRARQPDVVVLAPVDSVVSDSADAWLRADVPHLFAGVRETTGVCGPFVLPGRSSCLRCADLHRTDRDPAWPAVAAQLSARAAGAVACDVALATLVGAQAALQVLALLDGHDPPPAVGATLETRLPGALTRRRVWSMHPGCGCGWGALGAADDGEI